MGSVGGATRIAVLDVDGTLVDTNYHHALAWYRAFRSLGETFPVWRIHRLIGMGGDQLVAALGGDDVEARIGDEVRERWVQEADPLMAEVALLPGARELIVALKERGHRVVLASSGKPHHVDHGAGPARRPGRSSTAGRRARTSRRPSRPRTSCTWRWRRSASAPTPRASSSATRSTTWRRRRSAGMPAIVVRSGGFGDDELRDAGAVADLRHPGRPHRRAGRDRPRLTLAGRAPLRPTAAWGVAPEPAQHLVGVVGDDRVDAEVADEVHVGGACSPSRRAPACRPRGRRRRTRGPSAAARCRGRRPSRCPSAAPAGPAAAACRSAARSGMPGARSAIRRTASCEKLIIRTAGFPAHSTGRPFPSSPKRRRLSTSASSTFRACRVGCLVSIASRTRAGAGGDVLQQPVQGEDQAVLDVGLVGDGGDLVVGPRGSPAGPAGPELELLELVEVQGGDDAAAVGGVADPPVVHAHQHAVAGHPHVALHARRRRSRRRGGRRPGCARAPPRSTPRWATTSGPVNGAERRSDRHGTILPCRSRATPRQDPPDGVSRPCPAQRERYSATSPSAGVRRRRRALLRGTNPVPSCRNWVSSPLASSRWCPGRSARRGPARSTPPGRPSRRAPPATARCAGGRRGRPGRARTRPPSCSRSMSSPTSTP